LKADLARRQAEAGQREQMESAQRRAAEEAAQRKAESEAAALRLSEEEARKKAAVEAEGKPADAASARTEAERRTVERGVTSSESGSTRNIAPAVAGTEPAVSPDGLWSGTYACDSGVGADAFEIELQVRLTSGSGTWRASRSQPGNGSTLDIQVSVDGSAVSIARAFVGGQTGAPGRSTLTGQYRGNTINATGKEPGSERQCVVVLSRA
ncbi:MAG: hypothetical protein AB7F22_33380, partial [Reyranella sp.]